MEAVAKRRIPGVYFQVVQPAPEAVLPRMDIAGFVGFAAQGPVNRPVAVEDPRRLRDVFGGDLPLVWDPVEGRMETAYLAPAVEAFFRNGGRRCWVVRVARDAMTNVFPLAGLVDAGTGRPALIDARCPGSWSDDLRVGTLLSRTVLSSQTGDLQYMEDRSYELTLTARADQVRPGDLLRLAHTTGEELYATVAARASVGSGRIRITAVKGQWFINGGASLGPATAVLVSGRGESEDAELPPCTVRLDSGEIEVVFESVPDVRPGAGDVLHLTLHDNPPGQRQLWLTVREAHLDTDFGSLPEAASDVGSLPEAASEVYRVTAVGGLRPLALSDADIGALIGQLQDTAFTVERLTMSLLVWRRRELQSRMDDLGLSGWLDLDAETRSFAEKASGREIATRFWGRLPDDDALFQFRDGLPIDFPQPGSIERDAFEPRFPLAAPAAPSHLYIPLAVPVTPDPSQALGRLDGSAAPSLEREGLAGFDAGLFLDDDLRDVRLGSFSALAEDKLYLRRQALTGLHSLLPIEEVTLLSVPDAAHRGWAIQEPFFIPQIEAPEWTAASPEWLDEPTPCLPGVFRLCWTSAEPASDERVYELQESTQPDFSIRAIRARGKSDCAKILFDESCTRVLYYRVRIEDGNRRSPWSSTLRLFVPEPDFMGDPPLDAPALSLDASQSRLEGELAWTAVPGADRYRLQAAVDPAFVTGKDIKRNDLSSLYHPLDPLPGGTTFYRVRTERTIDSVDEIGPWSETVFFEPIPRPDWSAHSPASFDEEGSPGPGELIALHRALLRFCTARGDVVALLSLPSHYREEQAFAHVAALTPDLRDDDRFPLLSSGVFHTIPPLSLDEGRVLSYGAMYHPWPAVRAESRRDAGIRFSPPDGAVAGMMAARAITRGAWVAPANVPLVDVLAVDPEIRPERWQGWLDASINAIMRDPRGFSPMSADTLSRSSELRPISVRRLLILLRRLALREGNNFVFESNGTELRRRIRFQFLGLLSQLFERGAFAGASPEQAFRIETGPVVNPPDSIDQGRLVVELRVAPSRPLSFITVRLIQHNGSGFNVEEF